MESGFLPESRKISIGQSLQRWLALLIEYFELKIRPLDPMPIESITAVFQAVSIDESAVSVGT
jgi:hypothetical protein